MLFHSYHIEIRNKSCSTSAGTSGPDFGDSQLRPGHHGQRRQYRQVVEERARKEQKS